MLRTAITFVVVASAIAVAAAAEPKLVERGKSLYEIYCSNCHGPGAGGDGPTAQYLRVRPADLTRLSEKNGGVFPFSEVYRAIDGRETISTHGSRAMPIWGLAFQELGRDASQEDEVRGRILQLIEFLKTVQRLPTESD